MALGVTLGSTGLPAGSGHTLATALRDASRPSLLAAAEVQQPCFVTDSSDLHAAGAQTTIDLSKALPGQPVRLIRAVPNQNGALSSVPSTGPGNDAPGSAADCQWVGDPTTPTPPNDLTITISVNLEIVPWSTEAVARQAWNDSAKQYPPTEPGVGSPPTWSTAAIGDAAVYSGPGPLNDQVLLDVLDGTHTFSISLIAIDTVFNQTPPPWLTLANAVIAQLTPPARTATTVVPCQNGQLPDVGSPCVPPTSAALTRCPVGSGSDVGYGSRFDAATDAAAAGSFGGIYAHIFPAPACSDPSSDPPTSSWVMLQAPHDNPHVFAQAGIFYGTRGQSPGTDHPFFEVDYPELYVNGTVELDFPLTSGTFTVQVYGPSHQAIPICINWDGNGRCTSTSSTTDTEEIRFWIDGKPYLAGFIPAKYTGDLAWANLATEIHTTWSQFPGDCSQDLLFADAHVYQSGTWQTWESNATEVDLPDTSGQVVRPGGMSVWSRQPSC